MPGREKELCDVSHNAVVWTLSRRYAIVVTVTFQYSRCREHPLHIPVITSLHIAQRYQGFLQFISIVQISFKQAAKYRFSPSHVSTFVAARLTTYHAHNSSFTLSLAFCACSPARCVAVVTPSLTASAAFSA